MTALGHDLMKLNALPVPVAVGGNRLFRLLPLVRRFPEIKAGTLLACISGV